MIDFYVQLRQRMIDTMQNSLKQVRQVLGFGVQEFADIIGLTRQTINNLENKKTKMSMIQYVAICAVIDYCTKDKPELLEVFSKILSSNDVIEGGDIFNTIQSGSLLKKWFLCFSDELKINGAFKAGKGIAESEDYLEIANSYKVFFDETVLCEDGFEDKIQPLVIAMKENQNQFIIPLKVVEVIQGMLVSSNVATIEKAQKGLNLIMRMQQENMIEIRGEKGDVNVVSTFISVFAKFKCVNRLALITQNYRLAKQVLALNNDDIGGFNILVVKYDENIGFTKWSEEEILKVDSNELDSNSNITETNCNIENILKGWESID